MVSKLEHENADLKRMLANLCEAVERTDGLVLLGDTATWWARFQEEMRVLREKAVNRLTPDEYLAIRRLGL